MYNASIYILVHEYLVFCFTLVRGCAWELFNIDCKYLDTVVRNHQLNPSINGTICFFYPFVVIEMDIPWDDSQVAKYGPSFKAWGEEEIEAALAAIKESLPMNKLSYVVQLIYFQFYHNWAQRDIIQRLLAKDCESVTDLIMYKIGNLNWLSIFSRCWS